MTDEERTEEELERYVRTWQRRLGLDEWRIEINLDGDVPEHNDEKAEASAIRSQVFDDAEVRFHPDWRMWSPYKLETVVVHELLHLVIRDLELIVDDVDGLLHRDVHDVIREGYRRHVEQAVDRLAHRLVRLVEDVRDGRQRTGEDTDFPGGPPGSSEGSDQQGRAEAATEGPSSPLSELPEGRRAPGLEKPSS